MRYTLRHFEEADAEALQMLALAAIKTIGPAGYSPRQVDMWAARHSDADNLLERTRKGHRIFIIAGEDNLPVAFSLIEPDGHVDQLYCHPSHTRQGWAGQVLGTAENHAKALGVTRLYTEASEMARPVFERAGYSLMHRRDFKLGGIAMHNSAMEKLLG